MIQVAVFVSPQTVCSSLSQTCDAFSLANRLAGQRLFALYRFSVDGQPVTLDYAQIQVDGDLSLAEEADLVVDAVADGGQVERRQRVEEAGSQAAETAVA